MSSTLGGAGIRAVIDLSDGSPITSNTPNNIAPNQLVVCLSFRAANPETFKLDVGPTVLGHYWGLSQITQTLVQNLVKNIHFGALSIELSTFAK